MADHSVTKTAELFKFSIDPIFKMMLAFKIRVKAVMASINLEQNYSSQRGYSNSYTNCD